MTVQGNETNEDVEVYERHKRLVGARAYVIASEAIFRTDDPEIRKALGAALERGAWEVAIVMAENPDDRSTPTPWLLVLLAGLPIVRTPLKTINRDGALDELDLDRIASDQPPPPQRFSFL